MAQMNNFTWPGREPEDFSHMMLADFLSADIQSNIAEAARLISEVDAIASGHSRAYQRIGNLYVLQVTATQAVIEDSYDARRAEIPFKTFRDAAHSWHAFLTKRE